MFYLSRQYQWKLLDNHRRQFFHRNFLKKQLIKSLKKNKTNPLYLRYYAMFQQSNLVFNSSICRPRNRCSVSGRQYNVVRRTKTCRFVFRFESYSGFLPGVRRSSW